MARKLSDFKYNTCGHIHVFHACDGVVMVVLLHDWLKD